MKTAASRYLALVITAVLAACTTPRDAPRDGDTAHQSADRAAPIAKSETPGSEPAVSQPRDESAAGSGAPSKPKPADIKLEADSARADKDERNTLADETGPAAPLPAAAPSGSVTQAEPEPRALSAKRLTEERHHFVGEETRNYATYNPVDVPAPPVYQQPTDTESYQHQDDNPVHLASEQPFSTFSIDVDTGSYANVRRFLNAGRLPPQDAVRVEEMINYFDYQYAPPRNRDQPFRVATELAPAPWNANAWLLRIGIKGFEVSAEQRPAANLVFLVDVSGSMQTPDKLPLLKNSLRLLSEQLTARDRVSMVVYAGSTGVVLEPTPGDQKGKIQAAIEKLEAGGSTNGGEGIRRAYQLAHEAQVKEGINRVILATDGDFNVGIVNFEALIDMAEQQRATGVALTTLGFGTGNYNDQLLERLADAGNGNYAYVDTLAEARKVLVSELSSTLFTIAKDVKIQVEFNPAEVLEYRLIGYENRALKREDFNNDKVDAGEIGAGHRVTALYEIVKASGKGLLDPPRYGTEAVARGAKNGELAHLRLRYKQPNAEDSQLIEFPIMASSVLPARQTSADFRFAASVAAFGQMLRGGKYTGKFDYDDVKALAKDALAEDGEGYRREFLSLVKLAQALTPAQPRTEQRVGDAR